MCQSGLERKFKKQVEQGWRRLHSLGGCGKYAGMNLILQNCKIRQGNVSKINGLHFPALLYWEQVKI